MSSNKLMVNFLLKYLIDYENKNNLKINYKFSTQSLHGSTITWFNFEHPDNQSMIISINLKPFGHSWYPSLDYRFKSDFGTGTALNNIDWDQYDTEDIQTILEKLKIENDKMRSRKDYKDIVYYNGIKDLQTSNTECILNNFYCLSKNKITFEEYQDSKLSFTDFTKDKIGYNIDEDIYYEFLEVVPPLYGDYYLCCGEPYSTKQKGDKEINTYISFHFFNNRWYYSGLKTLEEMKAWEKFSNIIFHTEGKIK